MSSLVEFRASAAAVARNQALAPKHAATLVALPPESPLSGMRAAQQVWARLSVRGRLRILRAARAGMVSSAMELAASVPLERAGSLHRTVPDTLVAEVLPLVEACRFLEREAGEILAPARETTRSRPFWLRRVTAETRRDAVGLVLVVAPGNYPLFLPGVQVLQALAAGNAVLWKPAPGGSAAANALKKVLLAAGLDPLLVTVLDEAVEAATGAIRSGVDKVFLTGSADTGRAVLAELAEKLTPAVMELSGCDAVFVLDGADLDRAAAALAFGLRLNGAATCMSPRRLLASVKVAGELRERLVPLLEAFSAVPVTGLTAARLAALIEDAENMGARVVCGGVDRDRNTVRAVLLDGVHPEMELARTDIAAPVLSMIETPNIESALAAYDECPFALTAAVFGPESVALRVAARTKAGVVLINDVIVSTADPRAAFGGRGESGFGSARGREGLLEMTAVKTVLIQRSRDLRPYEETTAEHGELFTQYLTAAHGSGLGQRLRGLVQLVKAAMRTGKQR